MAAVAATSLIITRRVFVIFKTNSENPARPLLLRGRRVVVRRAVMISIRPTFTRWKERKVREQSVERDHRRREKSE